MKEKANFSICKALQVNRSQSSKGRNIQRQKVSQQKYEGGGCRARLMAGIHKRTEKGFIIVQILTIIKTYRNIGFLLLAFLHSCMLKYFWTFERIIFFCNTPPFHYWAANTVLLSVFLLLAVLKMDIKTRMEFFSNKNLKITIYRITDS